MKLKNFIEQVQIREKVIINVLTEGYTQKSPDGYVEYNGDYEIVYETPKGKDFKHLLKIEDIDSKYLDYDVYCICGLESQYKIVIDIIKSVSSNLSYVLEIGHGFNDIDRTVYSTIDQAINMFNGELHKHYTKEQLQLDEDGYCDLRDACQCCNSEDIESWSDDEINLYMRIYEVSNE